MSLKIFEPRKRAAMRTARAAFQNNNSMIIPRVKLFKLYAFPDLSQVSVRKKQVKSFICCLHKFKQKLKKYRKFFKREFRFYLSKTKIMNLILESDILNEFSISLNRLEIFRHTYQELLEIKIQNLNFK